MAEDDWTPWFTHERDKLEGTDLREGKRGYLHFDSRINKLDEVRTRALLDPTSIAQHTFYPFIRIDTREERFRKSKLRIPGVHRREHSVKQRPIDYASHKDAIVFSRYAYLISARYEAELARRGIGKHVIAYRAFKNPDGTGKTNVHFANEAFDFIEAHQPCYVMAMDITKFYEEIDHELLKRQWSQLVGQYVLPPDQHRVFEAITDYRFVRKERIKKFVTRALHQGLDRICTPKEFKKWVIDRHLQEKGCVGNRVRGIPQGAPISCVLANAYMLDFDTAVAGFLSPLPKSFYQRYSDDVLIVCAPEDAEKVRAFVKVEIEKLKLQVQDKKTELRLFTDGKCLDAETGLPARLQYLGIETDGATRLLRHSSVARYQRRFNKGVRRVVGAAIARDKKVPIKLLRKKYVVPQHNFLGYAKRAERVLKTGKIPQQVSQLKARQHLKKLLSKKPES